MDDQDFDPKQAWNPSAKQFEAYKAREVELAKQNIVFLCVTWPGTPRKGDTLHSLMTYLDAAQELWDTRNLTSVRRTVHR